MRYFSNGGLTRFAHVCLGLSVVLLLIVAVPGIAKRSHSEAELEAVPQTTTAKGRLTSGTERIAFFIASSTCGASAHTKLPAAIARMRAMLAEQAAAEGKRFVLVGVAVDSRPDDGLRFLKPFGPFDEILTG